MPRRLLAAVCGAALVLSVGASSVLAGEITGTGTLKTIESSKWGTGLHARSFCAFSGQEDLQWFTTNADTTRHAPTRGVPGHAQSWGQIPKATRATLTALGQNPGLACNPNKSTFVP